MRQDEEIHDNAGGSWPGKALIMKFTTAASLLCTVLAMPMCACGSPETALDETKNNTKNNTKTVDRRLQFTETDLPTATVKETYAAPLTVSNGAPPYTFKVLSGDLPPGLTVTDGKVTGTPTKAGLHEFELAVDDSEEASGSGLLRILVQAEKQPPGKSGPLVFWSKQLETAQTGTSHSQKLTVTGGTTPYQFSIEDGSLPAGLQLNAQRGTISGTASTAGLFPLTIRVADKDNTVVRRSLTMAVRTKGSDRPKLTLQASRTKGVAPFAVFFDANGTSKSGVSKPFHHLTYHWDFGDPNSRHPFLTGAVSAHVFETPGSYRVRLTVTAPDGSADTMVTTIVAEDPNKTFAGSKTICFSNDTDFSGAPAGAKKVTTNSWDSALGNFAANRRLLFKRGDTFKNSKAPTLTCSGVNAIGAFGSGTNRDERGIFSNNPTVESSGDQAPVKVKGSNLRIHDIRFVEVGSKKTTSMFSTQQHCKNLLILRLYTQGYGVPIGVSQDLMNYYKKATHDDVHIVDCHLYQPRLNSTYVGAARLAMIGSRTERCDRSHLFRITYMNPGVVAKNQMLYPGGTRHALKLHANQDKSVFPRFAERIVVSGNEIRAKTAWAAVIGPQDSQKNEELRDVLIEKNRFYSEKGVQIALMVNGQHMTVRNNLFLGSGSTSYDFTAVDISRRGVEPISSGMELYHNTYYNPVRGNTRERLVHIRSHNGAVLIKNNLIYAPNNKAAMLIFGSGANQKAGNVLGDPGFVNPGQSDFSLRSNSKARKAGVALPVLDDLRDRRRLNGQGKPDAGAVQD